ncbi:mediator of DNA damage checkpoint protein 1 [Anopheles ziemanni]|uniref:mediator of DNA damage checkpoint protein 1 n=1 Tax=Anopheles ziemanni TaxID=345580 RepID=UPI0026601EA9|nr:mediator of DNA damage checkpoint protein 1 [Anopheles ziemanni]
MNRIAVRGDHGVKASPKQTRLSVGLGTSASIQIHASATPSNILPRPISPHTGTPPTAKEADMTTPAGKRMSLHENLLLRILSTTPSDKPLFRQNSSDATPSQRTTDDSFDSCLSGSESPLLGFFNATPDAMRCNTPPNAEGIVNNRHLQMLYRDLNSPSATARLRALRALKSPSKRNAYGNFDVSYAEQDIITAEERIEPEKRDIRDILGNVCVYVEVRSGTDNRSDGIKEHVASLGAKVNERLLKDTTHVIFKDGLLSTYQKAKKMNIPVVSVLWIEACKRHMCLMNPDDFNISNVERYENPELFKRIRRQKSMQPGATETAGNKKRTAVTGKPKGPLVISPPSKLPVLHRIRNDDQLERILNDFEAHNQIANANTGPIDEFDEMLHGAPMRMLERFRSTPTQLDSPATDIARGTVDVDEAYTTPQGTTNAKSNTETRRELFAVADSGSKKSAGSSASRSRRRTILFTPQMKNLEEENVAPSPLNCIEETPKESTGRSRRRTMVAASEQTPQNVSETSFRGRRKTIVAVDSKQNHPAAAPTPNKRTRRSSMATGNGVKSPPAIDACQNQQRKTVVASKENISPSLLRTPVTDGRKDRSSTRSRRKTVTFGNEENTPPAVALGLSHTLITKRATICSPKDMEVSTIPQTSAPNTKHATELTKINSNGSEMSVTSPAEKSVINKIDGKTSTSVQRRSLFNPSAAADIVPGKNTDNTGTSVMSISSTSTGSVRRRTLFKPGNSTFMEPLEVSETPPEPSAAQSRADSTHNGSSICNRPNPTSSSTPKPTATGKETNMRRKTLLEAYEESVMFSSTRAPDRRRRTIFDISMDIMDQRLSEINRQAAAAKKQTTSGSSNLANEKDDFAAVDVQQSHPVGLISPPPSQGQQTSLTEFYRKAVRSCEKSSKPTERSTSSSSSVTEEPPAVVPRKRRLFNVQSTEEQPIAKTPPIASKPITARTTATKRRSLAPTHDGPMDQTASLKKRRTTALFESLPEAQATKKKQQQQQFPIGRGLPTVASQYNHGASNHQQERQYLATTNLHTEQTAFVKEAIEKLDGFIIEQDVSDNTTHLVSLEPRRTINLLRALVRGLWIVRYDWIVESFRARRWLPEEQFEVRDFSMAVQINRSERQAFGSQYRSELFTDYGPFWVSPGCAVPARQLRELLLLCRGKVTGNKLKAKYLVVENDDEGRQPHSEQASADGQIFVTPLWILDSITVNKVKKLSCKYRLG